MNWRFFQDTGKVGGIDNLSDRAFYIHSYLGDDANVGSNVAPFKTIQKAIDSCTGATATGGDFIVCGRFLGFSAGNWVGLVSSCSIIGEGYVVFDSQLVVSSAKNSTFSMYNVDRYAGGVLRNYGSIVFNNYTGSISRSSGLLDGNLHNCIFINCLSIYEFNPSIFSMGNITFCTLLNSSMNGSSGMNFINFNPDRNLIKNTFINSNFICRIGGGLVYDNYFDSTSYFRVISTSPSIPIMWNNNLFEGTLTNKIVVSTGSYNNIEAFQAANPTKAVNDLPSTTVPLLNIGTIAADYTLQAASPLIGAGHDRKQIGARSLGAPLAATNVAWTLSGCTLVGNAVELTGTPTGTMTSTGVLLNAKAREVISIDLPNFTENVAIGEVIALNLASRIWTLEIQHSLDDVTYSAWLEVPYGAKPLYDTVNLVGNGANTFDIGNAVAIKAKYLKYRITLRDDA